MKVRIHRGSKEIGGTCVEIACAGRRIVLDIGLPLDADDSPSLLPPVKGFRERDESLLAVTISHPHQDHHGLARHLRPDTLMVMGEATERILQVAEVFTPSGATFRNVCHLADRKPLTIGPFTITPFLIDHSAYDAYSLLIEGDGQRLFYSGDFRGHGRKAKLFQKLLRTPPKNVDTMLMEGTVVGRARMNGALQTEDELIPHLVTRMNETQGMVLVWASGQNIDRLVTIYKACRKARRDFIIDMYTAEILRAIGNKRLPQAGWPSIKVFIPESQERRITHSYRRSRIFPKHLAQAAPHSVMLMRPSMMPDLDRADCLAGAEMIHSLWPGYLKDAKQRPFIEWLDRHKIPTAVCHTSGHASVPDLQRLAKAIAPRMLVPIHTVEPKLFTTLFDNVVPQEDGKEWEVHRG